MIINESVCYMLNDCVLSRYRSTVVEIVIILSDVRVHMIVKTYKKYLYMHACMHMSTLAHTRARAHTRTPFPTIGAGKEG